MANIETELKQSATSNGGGPEIDSNNNNSKKSVAVPMENTTSQQQQYQNSLLDLNDSETKTPPNTPAPGTNNHLQQSLAENFKLFAKFGDIKSSGEAITLSNSDKWFKQAKIIDGKKITTTDTGIYWKQVAK